MTETLKIRGKQAFSRRCRLSHTGHLWMTSPATEQGSSRLLGRLSSTRHFKRPHKLQWHSEVVGLPVTKLCRSRVLQEGQSPMALHRFKFSRCFNKIINFHINLSMLKRKWKKWDWSRITQNDTGRFFLSNGIMFAHMQFTANREGQKRSLKIPSAAEGQEPRFAHCTVFSSFVQLGSVTSPLR